MDQINTSPTDLYSTDTSVFGYGQGFTGNGGKITEAKFRLYANEVGFWSGGTMWAEIYAHSGTWGSNGVPTGNPLAVSDIIQLQELGDFDDWISFMFSGNNQFQTVAGQKYFVVFNHDNSGFYVGPSVGITDNSAAFNGGTAVILKYITGWQLTVSYRILFQIFGTSPIVNYAVIYNGDGHTGGSVPIDGNMYVQSAQVTVKANTGGLVKTGHNFVGWANNSGASAPTFAVTGSNVNPPNFNMPASNVTLYATWKPVYSVT